MQQYQDIVETAYEKSTEMLHRQVRTGGMVAAGEGYHPVLTTRDIIFTYLGAALIPDADVTRSFRSSLETLAACRNPLGQIPNSYFFADGMKRELERYAKEAGLAPFDGMNQDPADFSSGVGGSIDATPLFTLGSWYHHELTRDTGFLRSLYPGLQRGSRWLSFQDSNACGLLEVQEASDWADIFPNRYNSLMSNVLYFAQLKCLALIAGQLGDDGGAFESTAAEIKHKINLLLWLSHEADHRREMLRTHRTWYRVAGEFMKLEERPYYLPYASFMEVGTYMDVLANLLAILFGVADDTRAGMILDHIAGAGIDKPYPVRAIDPPIKPQDKDWRPYMLLGQQNLPFQYHNGGIWPFIGGLYVAVLVKLGRHSNARIALRALAEENSKGNGGQEWMFKEWFHGVTGEIPPFAGSWMAWNAGMYLFAYESVRRGTPPVFNTLF